MVLVATSVYRKFFVLVAKNLTFYSIYLLSKMNENIHHNIHYYILMLIYIYDARYLCCYICIFFVYLCVFDVYNDISIHFIEFLYNAVNAPMIPPWDEDGGIHGIMVSASLMETNLIVFDVR